MKKMQGRKLTLHRETLRALNPDSLRKVQGGLFSMQTDTTCSDLTVLNTQCGECTGDGGTGSLSFDDCTAGCL